MGDPITLFIIGSTASTLLGGVSSYNQAAAQSKQMKLQAQAEELKGRQEVINVQNELLRTLASNTAATGASGTMMSGDPLRAQASSIKEAQETSGALNLNARIAATGLRAQASTTKRAGSLSLLGSVVSAGAAGIKNKLQIDRIG
jgi:DNA/RNA endonuclease YhcR with UshA esterase domain